jgi:hypothetical protein
LTEAVSIVPRPALQQRVAEDHHAEAGGERGEEGADAVQQQPRHQAPLASPHVGELAARDHQRRHGEREQRDGRLHAEDGGVQVARHRGDGDVHGRARVAADELGQRERQDHGPGGVRWLAVRHWTILARRLVRRALRAG